MGKFPTRSLDNGLCLQSKGYSQFQTVALTLLPSMKVNSYSVFPKMFTSQRTSLASSSTIPVSGSCFESSISCLALSLFKGLLSSVFHAFILLLFVISLLQANTKPFTKSTNCKDLYDSFSYR